MWYALIWGKLLNTYLALVLMNVYPLRNKLIFLNCAYINSLLFNIEKIRVNPFSRESN